MLYITHDIKSIVVCALWVNRSFIRDMSNNVSKKEVHSIKLYILEGKNERKLSRIKTVEQRGELKKHEMTLGKN